MSAPSWVRALTACALVSGLAVALVVWSRGDARNEPLTPHDAEPAQTSAGTTTSRALSARMGATRDDGGAREPASAPSFRLEGVPAPLPASLRPADVPPERQDPRAASTEPLLPPVLEIAISAHEVPPERRDLRAASGEPLEPRILVLDGLAQDLPPERREARGASGEPLVPRAIQVGDALPRHP